MFTSPPRPENELLVHIARRSMDESTVHQIKELLARGALDWEYIAATAAAHGVGALLAHHLQLIDCDLLPAAVMSRLQLENQQNTERCMALAGKLTRIAGALAERGIASIPFKGPTLALMAYGDLGLRQFADLDILIRKKDIAPVKATLAARGFVPLAQLSRGREVALLRFDNAYAFKNDQDVLLDVHWRLVPAWFSLAIETEELWQRLEPVNIGGRTLTTLSAEDLLLVLCCHGYTHSWERLGWICDVAGLIEGRSELDWNYVFDRAKRLGVFRVVLLGLTLAGELLISPVPSSVMSAIDTDKVVKRFAEKFWKELFARQTRSSTLGALALGSRMRERTRDQLKSLFAFVLTPRHYDWEFVSLPASFTLAYYAVRPIRWATDRARNLLKKG